MMAKLSNKVIRAIDSAKMRSRIRFTHFKQSLRAIDAISTDTTLQEFIDIAATSTTSQLYNLASQASVNPNLSMLEVGAVLTPSKIKYLKESMVAPFNNIQRHSTTS